MKRPQMTSIEADALNRFTLAANELEVLEEEIYGMLQTLPTRSRTAFERFLLNEPQVDTGLPAYEVRQFKGIASKRSYLIRQMSTSRPKAGKHIVETGRTSLDRHLSALTYEESYGR